MSRYDAMTANVQMNIQKFEREGLSRDEAMLRALIVELADANARTSAVSGRLQEVHGMLDQRLAALEKAGESSGG